MRVTDHAGMYWEVSEPDGATLAYLQSLPDSTRTDRGGLGEWAEVIDGWSDPPAWMVSDRAGRVIMRGDLPPVPPVPVNVTPPVAVGDPVVGATLSIAEIDGGSHGTWTGDDLVFTTQWERLYESIGTPDSETYTIVSDDIGNTIWCVVTATNDEGSTSANSNFIGPVALLIPVNTEAPAISGDPFVGETLSCSEGVWTNDPTSFAYHWRRDGVNISGETGDTYELATADIGHAVDCRVTATNADGSSSASSNAVGDIDFPNEGIISGGVVTEDHLFSPLAIKVTAVDMRLGSVEGSFMENHLGVSAGDATYDRIDVVYALSPAPWTAEFSSPNPPGFDTAQEEGVPAASPVIPGWRAPGGPFVNVGYQSGNQEYFAALYSYRVPAGATSSDQFTDFTDLRHIVT